MIREYGCIYSVLLLLFLHASIIISQDNETTTEEILKRCKETNQLIGSNKTELYDVIEAVINETIIIECHYCNENDPHEPKIWYKYNHLNSTAHEIEPDMHKNESLNRISITVEHSLKIHHLEVEDTGTYFCRGVENTEDTIFFNYIVDLINSTSNKLEKGNLTDWRHYFDDYIKPINEKLTKSNETNYLQIRNDLKTQLEVITDWKNDYEPCEVCGRPAGEGIQEKNGLCRIIIENNSTELQNIDMSKFNSSEKLKYFLRLPKVSCYSFLFEELFPEVSLMTIKLEDFVLIKKCNGTCNPDAEGVNRGWKVGSSKNYKYRKTVSLNEGDHLTVICPDSTLDNKIIWRKNGKVLPQGEPIINTDEELNTIHTIVDAFNSLYLIHVTEAEQGNYTCQVDQIKMQQIRVFVRSKSRLLTQEFLRHMKYLVFILLLSGSCYCAGVFAACYQKDKFKGYEQIPKATTTYV